MSKRVGPPVTKPSSGDFSLESARSEQRSLEDRLMALEAKFSPPTYFHQGRYPTLPAKYSAPTKAKDLFKIKNTLADGRRQVLFDESDAEVIRDFRREKLQAMFDQWISNAIDIRVPGNYAWLNALYPEYTESRVRQIAQDLEHIFMEYKLRYFGVQDKETLYYKFLKENGFISNPPGVSFTDLTEGEAAQRRYIGGRFSLLQGKGTLDRTRVYGAEFDHPTITQAVRGLLPGAIGEHGELDTFATLFPNADRRTVPGYGLDVAPDYFGGEGGAYREPPAGDNGYLGGGP